jgi:effector-binding domain-containing protein
MKRSSSIAAHATVAMVTEPAHTVTGLRQTVEVQALSDFFAEAMPTVAAALADAGLQPDGGPISIYRQRGGGAFEVTVGFPVDGRPETGGPLVAETLPGGPVATAVHSGSYDTLASTYDLVIEWLTARHIAVPEMMWEEYLVGPDSTPDPSAWRTRVVFPLPRG